jgi:hypothetical protein
MTCVDAINDSLEEIVRVMLGIIGFSNDVALKPMLAARTIKREIAEALQKAR